MPTVRDLVQGMIDALPRRENINRATYEDAVASASEEDLVAVAKLTHSQLREWVEAPARLRSILLKAWGEKDKAREARVDALRVDNARLDQQHKETWERIRQRPGFWKGLFKLW